MDDNIMQNTCSLLLRAIVGCLKNQISLPIGFKSKIISSNAIRFYNGQ